MNFETETELAWLAGFIDGEGCIRVSKDARRGRGLPQYYMNVQITQKNPEVLVAVKDRYGGSLCVSHSDTGGVSNLHLKARKAAALLNDILPYLVLKKKQAEIALSFQSRRLEKSPGSKPIDRTQDEADYLALKSAKVVSSNQRMEASAE